MSGIDGIRLLKGRHPELRLIALFREFRPSPPRADHDLTPHEVRILSLLAEGHSYRTAAAALDNSINTVAAERLHAGRRANAPRRR